MPPPPLFHMPVPTRPHQSTSNPIYISPPEGVSDEVLYEILDVMRENQSYQIASVQQQDILLRHLGQLNDWMVNDRSDRGAQFHGMSARIDQLREDLEHLHDGGHERASTRSSRRTVVPRSPQQHGFVAPIPSMFHSPLAQYHNSPQPSGTPQLPIPGVPDPRFPMGFVAQTPSMYHSPQPPQAPHIPIPGVLDSRFPMGFVPQTQTPGPAYNTMPPSPSGSSASNSSDMYTSTGSESERVIPPLPPTWVPPGPPPMLFENMQGYQPHSGVESRQRLESSQPSYSPYRPYS